MITKTIKKSICPCSFSVLHDDIELGSEFTVYPSSITSGFKYKCGGCGKTQNDVTVVLASSITNQSASPNYLPIGIFDTLSLVN